MGLIAFQSHSSFDLLIDLDYYDVGSYLKANKKVFWVDLL